MKITCKKIDCRYGERKESGLNELCSENYAKGIVWRNVLRDYSKGSVLERGRVCLSGSAVRGLCWYWNEKGNMHAWHVWGGVVACGFAFVLL